MNGTHVYDRCAHHNSIYKLETVDLELFFLHDPLGEQELRNWLSLITLQLDDLTHLRIVDNRAIAAKLLRNEFLVKKAHRANIPS